MSCVLGLDIGTTSTIGILIRLPGTVLGVVSRAVQLFSPQPGWAEEDPQQWWDNVRAICRELLESTGTAADEVAAVGVTGMTPPVVLLDAGGELLRRSIQQSDGRCGEQITELRAEHDEAEFLARTGNGINQQLVAPKLRWLARHEPEVAARIATVFGSYDYINWRLTGERAVEQNWALEAGFVDVRTDRVDPELIALTGLPTSAVPRKIRSHEILGRVSAAAAAQTGLRPGTAVIGGTADLIASALAAGIVAPGDVLIKFGGSVDILTASRTVHPDARMFLDYHLIPGLYMPNGCMATGGSGLNWFAANFAGGQLAEAERRGLSLHQWLDQLAAQRPAGSDGVAVLPYFLGEKTPLHDPAARGVFEGLSLSHDIGHLWRALLEAYAYAIAHHVEVLRAMGHTMRRFVVSDGGAASGVWMQIVADVLQEPVQRLAGHPGSCLGAAWTAAIGAGLESDWGGISRFVSAADLIEPNAALAGIYSQGYVRFRALYNGLYGRAAGQGVNSQIMQP
jgi:xylulokinase